VCPQLCKFIHDVKWFVRYNRRIIEETPLQIYYSALIFAPEKSIVREHFENRVLRQIKIRANVGKDRNSLQQILEFNTVRRTFDHSHNPVVFSPDGTILAASSSETIQLWDVATGAERVILKGHSEKIHAIAFSLDGKLLVSAARDNMVKLWDTAAGAEQRTWTIKDYIDNITALAFSPNGILLASASSFRKIELWDVVTGKREALKSSSGLWTAMAFSRDSKLIAAWNRNKEMVSLWDTASGEVQMAFLQKVGLILAMAFSHDSKLLLTMSSWGTIKLLHVATGSEREILRSVDSMGGIDMSPDNSVVATAFKDTVKLWDTGLRGKEVTIMATPTQLQLRPSPQTIHHKHQDQYDEASAKAAMGMESLPDHARDITGIAFLPNKSPLQPPTSPNIKLWDITAKMGIDTYEHGKLQNLVLSPDSTQLASMSNLRIIQLWDSVTGAEQHTLKLTGNFVEKWTLRERLWVLNGEYIHGRHEKRDFRIRFSKNGRHILTAEGVINLERVGSRTSHVATVPSSIYEATKDPTIGVTKGWITLGSKNLVRIHDEFAYDCFLVKQNLLVLGHPSGRVSFYRFGFWPSLVL
jgi:WD40 repeat protein